MRKGLFITGTDTGVGKTLVGGALAYCLYLRGMDIGVMKPIESGCKKLKGNLIPRDALFLKKLSKANDDLNLISPYPLKHPLAPATAAEIEGIDIKLNIIKKIYNKIKKKHELILVEGAGGLLTPITKTLVIADLIKSLRLPAIVITRSSLGTINHTLLTLRVAEASNIDILGIIINHLGPKMGLAEKTCQIYLQKFTHIPILGIFPFVQEIKRKNTKYLADLVERYINIELLLEHLILKN